MATKKELKIYLTVAIIVIAIQSILLNYSIFANQNTSEDIFNTENEQIESRKYEYAYDRQADRPTYYLDFDYTFYNYSSNRTIVLHDKRIEDIPPFLHFNIVELREGLVEKPDLLNYTLHLVKGRHDISRLYFLPGDDRVAEALIEYLKVKPYTVVLDREIPENVFDLEVPEGAGVAIYGSEPGQGEGKELALVRRRILTPY